eukprot:1580209-Amphidinium_carterae.1
MRTLAWGCVWCSFDIPREHRQVRQRHPSELSVLAIGWQTTLETASEESPSDGVVKSLDLPCAALMRGIPEIHVHLATSSVNMTVPSPPSCEDRVNLHGTQHDF